MFFIFNLIITRILKVVFSLFLYFLPRILVDGLLEIFKGAVGVPSSIGEVMELRE